MGIFEQRHSRTVPVAVIDWAEARPIGTSQQTNQRKSLFVFIKLN